MPINITYDNNKLYNSIKIVNTDTASYYKYVNSQELYFNKNVQYEITYRIYCESTSSHPFDLYITSSQQNGFFKTNINGFLVDVVNCKLNTYTEKQHVITPKDNCTASIALLLKYGTYYISEFKVKPYHRNNFSLGEMDVVIPSPPIKRNEPLSIYPVYIGRNNKPIGYTDVTLADAGQATDFTRYKVITGSNLIISNDDNLIEGSLFVGNNLRTGVEISGQNNAMIRSVGYAGFNNAILYNWPGFLLYSGSVLPGSGDNYRGVGLELHGGGNSGSFRYRVDDSGSLLEITGSIYATDGYFNGTISASVGKFGGWTIDSHSFYSDTITMWSTQSKTSGSAIEFYDRINNKTYLSIAIQDRVITSFITSQSSDDEFFIIPVSESIETVYFTLGESLNNNTGSSLIFDFVSAGNALPGNMIVTGAKFVEYSLFDGGEFKLNSPFYINGNTGNGTLNSIWKKNNSPNLVYNNTDFVYNNKFHIEKYGTFNSIWDNITVTASSTSIYSTNNNYYGKASSSTWQQYGKINDTIHAGIFGENISAAGYGIKVGLYGRAKNLTINSVLSNPTHSNRGVAVLGDAVPGTTAWSGLFRYGRFGIGDPFSIFLSSSVSSSAPEIVFYVDASRKNGNTMNPSFGRVGINTFYPQYSLHVEGASGSSGIIYASDDIIAFSDVRKKMNIQQMTGSLDKILNLRGVSFNLKKDFQDNNIDSKRKIGLIAQEVEPVLPEVVYTAEDGYKSIAYGNIVALLIEGIKEQNKEILNLRNEIEKLKEKLLKKQ